MTDECNIRNVKLIIAVVKYLDEVLNAAFIWIVRHCWNSAKENHRNKVKRKQESIIAIELLLEFMVCIISQLTSKRLSINIKSKTNRIIYRCIHLFNSFVPNLFSMQRVKVNTIHLYKSSEKGKGLQSSSICTNSSRGRVLSFFILGICKMLCVEWSDFLYVSLAMNGN